MSVSATTMIQTYLNKMFHVNAFYLYQFIGDFFNSLLVFFCCFFLVDLSTPPCFCFGASWVSSL